MIRLQLSSSNSSPRWCICSLSESGVAEVRPDDEPRDAAARGTQGEPRSRIRGPPHDAMAHEATMNARSVLSGGPPDLMPGS